MKSTVVGLRREGYNVRVLDVDAHQKLVREYGIRSIPAFVYVRDGDFVRKKAGRLSESAMKRMCRDSWL